MKELIQLKIFLPSNLKLHSFGGNTGILQQQQKKELMIDSDTEFSYDECNNNYINSKSGKHL